MKARELELCQIQIWYPLFRSVSLKTFIHPLPEPFVSYLLEDGLFLPRSSEALPSRAPNLLESHDYLPWAEEDEDDDEPNTPSFPELEAAVRSSIDQLGGSVFPKLNWSAPKDTAWISPSGSLKCQNFGEVALLLKASENLVHDLSHAFEACEDRVNDRPDTFFLALRKWYDLRPEMEFRGFVRDGLLVGISQREVTGFYSALLEKEDVLESVIYGFFTENLSERFDLDDYTFDCYVTRDERVKLVDFNPWGAFTLPLLFTWEELEGTYARLKLMLAGLDEDAGTQAEIGAVGLCCAVEEEAGNEGVFQETRQADLEIESITISDMPVVESENPSVIDSFGISEDNERTKVFCEGNENEVEFASCTTRKTLRNVKLRKRGYKVELRVVKSEGLVQPNLRLGGGVPFDYVNSAPGSAWDEFLRRADEDLQQQMRDTAAGG